MKVGSVAGQDDDSTGWVCFQFLGIELVTQADVENASNDGINSVFRMSVRQQLHSMRNLNPNRVRTGFGGLSDDDCETNCRRKCREGFPIHIVGKHGSE